MWQEGLLNTTWWREPEFIYMFVACHDSVVPVMIPSYEAYSCRFVDLSDLTKDVITCNHPRWVTYHAHSSLTRCLNSSPVSTGSSEKLSCRIFSRASRMWFELPSLINLRCRICHLLLYSNKKRKVKIVVIDHI